MVDPALDQLTGSDVMTDRDGIALDVFECLLAVLFRLFQSGRDTHDTDGPGCSGDEFPVDHVNICIEYSGTAFSDGILVNGDLMS